MQGPTRIEEQRALCICTGSALLFNPRRPPVKPCKVSRFTRELEKPFDNGSESGPTGHACCCRKSCVTSAGSLLTSFGFRVRSVSSVRWALIWMSCLKMLSTTRQRNLLRTMLCLLAIVCFCLRCSLFVLSRRGGRGFNFSYCCSAGTCAALPCAQCS